MPLKCIDKIGSFLFQLFTQRKIQSNVTLLPPQICKIFKNEPGILRGKVGILKLLKSC